MLNPLPIDEVLPELLEAVRDRGVCVLKAPAGAGKTTRVPPALLDHGFVPRGQLLLLEPRRMAARSAARRIAQERGVSVGHEVGYQVRFDDSTSRDTRLIAMTEGILIRRLQDDPLLEEVEAIVFDEFHERHLDTDLALAMVTRVREARPDLKVVVMSATLAPEPIAAYLDNAPIVVSQGREYPVRIDFRRRSDRRPWPEQIAEAIEQAVSHTQGDLLAFLPGVGEIRRAASLLEPLARRGEAIIMPLYGDLPPEEQDRVLASQPRRKIVLATNVAESSITIEGIQGVIDSGVARILRFDADIGLDRLEVEPISKASADQRAGRAGRTGPGFCWRLWEEAAHRARPENDTPEVQRVDLSGAVLQLRCWGETDLQAFPWFEPPDAAALDQAQRLLQRLGALTSEGRPTDLGRRMARFPLPPRLARLLVAAYDRGVAERGILLAALLSERDPFRASQRDDSGGNRSFRGPITSQSRSRSDVLDRLAALEAHESGSREGLAGTLSGGALGAIRRSTEQLARLMDRECGTSVDDVLDPDEADEAILRALLDSYPDRLAKRRDPQGPRGLMIGGRGVKLAPSSSVIDAPFFLCIDVDARSGASETLVRLASAVEPEWLDPKRFENRTECFFHPTRHEMQARRKLLWDDLLIDEKPVPLPFDLAQAEQLAAAAKRIWQGPLPKGNEELEAWLTRVRCLAMWCPELQLPTFDDKQLEELLISFGSTFRSLDELRSAPWRETLESRLTPTQRSSLEREAPERIQVPGGPKLKLTYELGRPPILAAKIQDLFGWTTTPRVGGGRIPVLLHLLAPNGRPQQVTDDLASFWANTYAVVRKELRGRYPKHRWPEDPLSGI